MASNNSSLSASLDLTNLDFFGLKNSFKNYLRGQDIFKDYDFDGAALNVLLDTLAYNTYKTTFMTNMLHSEGFLDSAQLRSSLYSHSKELNYLPRSVRSAKAKILVSFEASGESQPYVIPKGAQFSSLIKSESYTFTTPETIIVSSANTTYEFTTDIYEGIFKEDSYIFLGTENQRFKITNKNVDTRSVTVTVYEDGDQIGSTYTVTNTLLDLTEFSKIFFLQTNETGYYEVYFGDNVLGRKPKLNSTIVIQYRISTGTKGDGARVFYPDFEPTGVNELIESPTISVIESSSNGSEEENNESIRYYAPRAFQVQERAITPTDYEISLKQEFSEINSVSVYGGELVTPPRFGKVFIAIDIADVDGLPEAKKTEYFNFLKRRSPLSIDPIIVEPEILYLAIKTLVRYNVNITTNSLTRIKTLITTTILDYNKVYLDDFDSTLRLSKLQQKIDDSDISIISNMTDVSIYKKINPSRGELQNIEINFNLPLLDTLAPQSDQYSSTDQKAVYSSLFRFAGETCILEDNGNGIMRIVKFSNTERIKIKNVGTVNYSTGTIILENFKIDDYDGAFLKIYGIPTDKDVASTQNIILQIEPDEISIDVEGIRL